MSKIKGSNGYSGNPVEPIIPKQLKRLVYKTSDKEFIKIRNIEGRLHTFKVSEITSLSYMSQVDPGNLEVTVRIKSLQTPVILVIKKEIAQLIDNVL